MRDYPVQLASLNPFDCLALMLKLWIFFARGKAPFQSLYSFWFNDQHEPVGRAFSTCKALPISFIDLYTRVLR